jgi:hypothetical protein
MHGEITTSSRLSLAVLNNKNPKAFSLLTGAVTVAVFESNSLPEKCTKFGLNNGPVFKERHSQTHLVSTSSKSHIHMSEGRCHPDYFDYIQVSVGLRLRSDLLESVGDQCKQFQTNRKLCTYVSSPLIPTAVGTYILRHFAEVQNAERQNVEVQIAVFKM